MEYKFKNTVIIKPKVVIPPVDVPTSAPAQEVTVQDTASTQEAEVRTNRSVILNERTGEFIIPFNQRRLYISL